MRTLWRNYYECWLHVKCLDSFLQHWHRLLTCYLPCVHQALSSALEIKISEKKISNMILLTKATVFCKIITSDRGINVWKTPESYWKSYAHLICGVRGKLALRWGKSIQIWVPWHSQSKIKPRYTRMLQLLISFISLENSVAFHLVWRQMQKLRTRWLSLVL